MSQPERSTTPDYAEVLAMGDSPCWPLKHDANCESVAVDIGVGEMHSPCGCEVRWYQRALRLFMPSETLFKDAAPQPSTAALTTAPSQEGVGHGDVAAAAPSDDKKDDASTPRTDACLAQYVTWMMKEERSDRAHGWNSLAEHARRLERELTAMQSAVGARIPDGLRPCGCLLDADNRIVGTCAAHTAAQSASVSMRDMVPSKYRDLIIESCAQRIEAHDVYTTAAIYFAKFLRDTKGNATDRSSAKGGK